MSSASTISATTCGTPPATTTINSPSTCSSRRGRLHYAIIDEVDNILIDEARTPLIISGPAHDDVTKYGRADKLARQLQKDEHFEVKEKEHTVNLTDEGVRAAEKLAGVESFLYRRQHGMAPPDRQRARRPTFSTKPRRELRGAGGGSHHRR